MRMLQERNTNDTSRDYNNLLFYFHQLLALLHCSRHQASTTAKQIHVLHNMLAALN